MKRKVYDIYRMEIQTIPIMSGLTNRHDALEMALRIRERGVYCRIAVREVLDGE